MLEISSQTEIDIESVLQYIIDGIPDEQVNKSVLYGARDIREFKHKLTIYESMKRAGMSHSRAKVNERNNFSGKEPTDRNTNAATSEKRCYNCGQKNHLAVNCPTKDKVQGVSRAGSLDTWHRTVLKRIQIASGLGPTKNTILGGARIDMELDGDVFPIDVQAVPDDLIRHNIINGTDFLNQLNLEMREGKISIARPDKREAD
ncbi:UNVERIFIED_CONTAM: hypothetical protein PYX00_006234 [Menopon gallinae]|uniref:CCHC-type domain-containing protein n=1 Tax=Menopon gallinae TaxID=328185 RepID=A0AAW2HV34_9NEOP